MVVFWMLMDGVFRRMPTRHFPYELMLHSKQFFSGVNIVLIIFLFVKGSVSGDYWLLHAVFPSP